MRAKPKNFIQRLATYQSANFLVRVLAFDQKDGRDDVVTANLRPPGGKLSFDRASFAATFEIVSDLPVVVLQTGKESTCL